MMTLDEYRELGLALRKAQLAEDHDEILRLEYQLASAPRTIRRIYPGEITPRRAVDDRPIRPELLKERATRLGAKTLDQSHSHDSIDAGLVGTPIMINQVNAVVAGLAGAPVAEDQHAADTRIDRRDQDRELHFVLADDG